MRPRILAREEYYEAGKNTVLSLGPEVQTIPPGVAKKTRLGTSLERPTSPPGTLKVPLITSDLVPSRQGQLKASGLQPSGGRGGGRAKGGERERGLGKAGEGGG